MKSIHIRNVDPETLERLKRLARSHNRSLQGELHAILTRAARMAEEEDVEEDLELITVKAGTHSSWSREEMYGDQRR